MLAVTARNSTCARAAAARLLRPTTQLPASLLHPTPASSAVAAAQIRPAAAHAAFATAAKSSALVFDKALKLAQRRRAARSPDFASYHYLRDEVAERLVDRLADINKAFPVTVEIGCGTGAHVSSRLHAITEAEAQMAAEARARAAAAAEPAAAAAIAASGAQAASGDKRVAPPTSSVPDRGVIRTLHICDSCPEALARTRDYWTEHAAPPGRAHEYHVLDEECDFPFADGSVDLIVSNLSMHWINDLPGFLKRCRKALKPDGVFLAAMLGGATLQELRSSMTVADLERLGGVQAHVSPFAYGRDCGDLLASAGFTMPTVDTDVLSLRYPDLFTLSAHLQGMGESNAALLRPSSVSRDIFTAAAATYEVFYMIGWVPHSSQPKPLERGSAKHKLAEIDEVTAAQQQQADAHNAGEEQAAPFKQ